MREEPRVLLTGADGMLGQDIRLVFADRRITALGRGELDVTDRDAVRDAVSEHDVVINCAAYTRVDEAEDRPDAAFAVNAIGAENLAEAAKAAGAHLIQLSTDYVFDGSARAPYAEDAPTHPISVYGASKAEGERLAAAAHPEGTTIVRTAWLYGEHGSNFAATMLRLASKGIPFGVVDDQFGQPTWTKDVARRLLGMMDAGLQPGILHATNSGVANRVDFAREAISAAGLDPAVVRPEPSSSRSERAARPHYSVLGHAAWHAVGIPPLRDWRAALSEAVDEGAVRTP